MGHKIERGSEIAWNTSVSLARAGFRTGRAAIGGTYAPFVLLWGIEKDARGFKERTMRSIPLLIPAVPGFIIGSITRDINLAALVGAGGFYAEGMVISSIYEFLCPPDERSFRKKLRSFRRAIAPGFSRSIRDPRLRLPR